MEIRTLCDILTNLERHFRKPDLLRFKADGEWRDIPTSDFADRVRSLSLGLSAAGVAKSDRVAILSENRPEWTIADHAILNAGAVTVPIYPTLLTDQARFILENSGARLLLVSGAAQLNKILPVWPDLPALERVIVFDPPGGGGAAASVGAAAAGGGAAAAAAPSILPPRVSPLAALYDEGRQVHALDAGRFELLRNGIGPDDLASILYTSGTTGEPKGVMLTHGNFASNVDATLRIIPFAPTDMTLSFLPLTHVFERMVEFAYLAAGASIAYAESIDAVPQNLAEIRPTCVASVPRLFEKVHARVLDGVRASSFVRRLIFGLALKVGRRNARAMLGGRAPLWARLLRPLTDRLVFSKLRARLGGRLRFFISGGAPLSAEIAEFFYAAGIRILEGYGLTETSPVIAVNTIERARLGTVGPILPGVEVKIGDDGEILTRGPHIMRGYYQNSRATADAIVDGWFHTGDIGTITPEGFLKITDRKKEVLKTSGGKMVAPQPIENLLKADVFIAQAVLIGDKRKFISALIVPDFAWMESYARHKGIAYRDVAELMHNERVLDLYRRRIEKVMHGHPSYETVKKFRFLPRELTQDSGELTPTLKVKRRVIEQKYADLIESMYAE